MSNKELEQEEAQKNNSEKVEETIELSKAELEDLKAKAEVSSQNFERAKKAELRAKELEELQAKDTSTDDVYSDEGRLLKKEIEELKNLYSQKDREAELESVMRDNPVLKEKLEDFETFRTNPDNQGMSLKTQAKAFMIENDLVSEPPKRKGLEKSTGSASVNVNSKMTWKDVQTLKETNWRKYQKMLLEGKFDNITD